MQPAPGLHIEWVEDEAVVLEIATGKLHYLNTSAALVLAAIDEYGYEEGIAHVKKTAGSDSVEGDVATLIENMVERGLLIDG